MKIKYFFVLLFALISLSIAFDGAKYLIIAPDNFVQYVQPLADWKTKKGVKSYIAPTSITGTTTYQIKNYILNAYNTWSIRPEYILIVGAGTVIPSYAIGGGDYSDDYYADISGDFKIELSIGRLPCTNMTQCQTNIAKILNYERTPYMTDTTWYRKATTILREDGTTHPDTVYYNDLKYVESFWQGFYTLIDTFSRLRGDDKNDVVNAITNGRLYVVYRGEATVNWYTPFQVSPNQTSNGFKLPVVISGTCGTLSFSQGGFLGDNFLNTGNATTPKGAAAFFGSSVSTSGTGLAWQRGTVTKGFFTALYRNELYHLGDASKRAKFILDSIRPLNYTETRYKEWNLFGDPEMNLWTTVPKRLTVTHDTIIETRPQNFTVTVRQNNVALNNALVCLLKDTSLYEYHYTNSTGQATFFIYPQLAGTMSVTVTSRNCIPYEQNVTVNTAIIQHDVGITSIIQPAGTIATGTNVIPKIKIKNFGINSDSFLVRFKIDSIYDQTTSVTLTPNDTMTVSFPNWTAIPGSYTITAFTNLSNDEWHGNDTIISTFNVVTTTDVGIEAILNLDSMYVINSSITPRVRIKNYGTLTQSNFTVVCSIIGNNHTVKYTNSQTISSLNANDTITKSFAVWTPDAAELCTMKIQTNLIGDQNPNNDQMINTTLILASAIAEPESQRISPITILYALKPNPVTGKNTYISFNLGEPSYVNIKIYDAAGRTVKNLVDEFKSSGVYKTEWNCCDDNGKQITKGIYFCSLTTQNQNFTKKFIVNY